MSETTAPAERPVPSIADLFIGFLWLGLTAFGGALPLARHLVVEQRRWLTASEFTDLLGLCQFLPGGNVINLAVAVGLRFRGAGGALAALLGLIAAPSAIVIGLGMVYDRYHDDPHVQHVFAGMAAAAAGLLITMAVRIAKPLVRQPWPASVAALCFIAIATLRLPLLWTMVVLTPLGILATWKGQR